MKSVKKNYVLFAPVYCVLILLCTAATVLTLFYDLRIFYVELAILVVALVFVFVRSKMVQRDIHRFLDEMEGTLSQTRQQALTGFPIPVFTVDLDGAILWYNDLARQRVLYNNDAYGTSIHSLIGRVNLSMRCPPEGLEIIYGTKAFTVFYTQPLPESKNMRMLYFVDDTKLKHLAKEYEMTRPSVLVILIDNYEELWQSAKDNERSQIFNKVGYMIEKMVESANGLIQSVQRDRYIAVLEERDLLPLIDSRFDILDKIRQVNAGGKMPATVSIGIGREAPNLFEAERMANQALDMALGRGGDQVAIKNSTGYEFYGGLSKGIEKRNKVKTRIVASALYELIESSENVLLMGHRFADLDCFGSAVGLFKTVQNMGKPCAIVIDSQKNLVHPLYDRLLENGYEQAFVEPQEALELIGKRTLLIIVDTHIEHILESKEVYQACRNIVVIDHHRKMVGHIDNAVIFYHEPYASSASEMVAELVQYFSEKQSLGQLEAEALLAGIMLDTKNFVIRTGVRTFEAAAYLKKLGADTVEVRKLFSSSMDSYQRRGRIVAGAEVYRNCAIAGADQPGGDDINIVAPQAADELLGISGVDASFVMYEQAGRISISARSMGALNVQLVMEKLGGGGHFTMAGAQIPDISMEDARQRLLEAIDEYYEEHSNN